MCGFEMPAGLKKMMKAAKEFFPNKKLKQPKALRNKYLN
jgi:hypothetical protein